MNVKLTVGFASQHYVAPHAESFEMFNEGILCASDPVTGGIEEIVIGGGYNWDGTETVTGEGGSTQP